MTCEWCHDFCPPNRKDGYCSDLCKEWADKAREQSDRLKSRARADQVGRR